ncbi:MAG: phospholipase D family protein [Planctomycetaceae bacterium]
MAKFLNTSGTTYFLEELIKGTRQKLILISPYLQLSDRVRELLEDLNLLKVDMRVVYGKSELQPAELAWLQQRSYIRTSFCKNLHAKCYLSEDLCIITSLNLYEFSQINNNEMGVLISRTEDPELYRDALEEANRLIRVSEEVRVSLQQVPLSDEADAKTEDGDEKTSKLSTSKLATKLGIKTNELTDKLVLQGFLELREGKPYLTAKGRDIGGEFRSSKFGPYFLWPDGLSL